MLTDRQKYSLNTNGLLIIKDFYNENEIYNIKQNITNLESEQCLYFHNNPELFLDFMAHEWIVSILTDLIGMWFRFDHELQVNQNKNSKPYLHGGQFGSQGTCTYQQINNNSWNGQITVGLALEEQSQNSGGFTYIPGSHHQSLQGQYTKQLNDIWDEMLKESDFHTTNEITTPELNPGDLYLFSEALIHGQNKWQKNTPRTTLYIKYVPGYMAWQDYDITKKYLDIASRPSHLALLRRPYVRAGTYDSPNWKKSNRRLINGFREEETND